MALIKILQLDLDSVMIYGRAPQNILKPHTPHEFSYELRAAFLRKLRPSIRLSHNHQVRVITQTDVAKVNVHLVKGPTVHPRIDHLDSFSSTEFFLQHLSQPRRVGFV